MTDINTIVPLPEAGPGIELKFTAKALRAIYTKQGGADWISRVFTALDACDIAMISDCLAVACHRGDEHVAVAFEDVAMPLERLAFLCADAFHVAIKGTRLKADAA